MAYKTATITDANPAAALIAAVESAMLEQGGEAWAVATAYGGTGQTKYVRGDVGGGVINIFEATTAGTSHASTTPTWSTANDVGETLTDGTVTWTNRGLQTWVFVEELVNPSSSTNTYRVWKCRGSGCAHPNSHGTDFHIYLYRATAGGATQMFVGAFESWDATNKKAIRPCPVGSSLAINANYSHGDETNGFTLVSTTLATTGPSAALITTGFDYGAQVSKDQILVWTRVSATDGCVCAGLFSSLLPTAHPFPLCILRSSAAIGTMSSNSVNATTSRHPNMASAQTDNFKHTMANFTSQAGDATSVKDPLHDKSLGSKVLLRPSGALATYGFYHGLLYNMMTLANGSTTWKNGDNIVVGGESWAKASGLNTPSDAWLDKSVI